MPIESGNTCINVCASKNIAEARELTRIDSGSFTQALSYLRCSPFKRNFSSMRDIVVTLFKISSHPKITNLQEEKQFDNGESSEQTITSLMTRLYLACCPILSYQNIPSCQISVHKSLPCQVLHA